MEKIKFKVLDGSNVGDYECSPTYQSSSKVVVVTSAAAGVRGKYCGDYERDPNYMSRLAANKQTFTFDPSLPHRIPRPDEVLEHGRVPPVPLEGCGRTQEQSRMDKYRGKYERCETYVFPPQHSQDGCPGQTEQRHGGLEEENIGPGADQEISRMESSVPLNGHFHGSSSALLDSKYKGNYERSPVYMENLLQSVCTESGTGTAATSQVPPNQSYTTLEPTTRETLQPYATTLTRTHNASASNHPLPLDLRQNQPLPLDPCHNEGESLPPNLGNWEGMPATIP